MEACSLRNGTVSLLLLWTGNVARPAKLPHFTKYGQGGMWHENALFSGRTIYVLRQLHIAAVKGTRHEARDRCCCG